MVFMTETQDGLNSFREEPESDIFPPICPHKKNTVIQLTASQQHITMSKKMYDNSFRDISLNVGHYHNITLKF